MLGSLIEKTHFTVGPRCLDASGRPVDYWVVYKHPKSYAGNVYTSLDKEWIGIGDIRSDALKATLEQQKVVIMAYNDQAPAHEHSKTKSHTKGFTGRWENGGIGFHVLHSHPKFPYFDGDDFFKHASEKMGQMYLCTTHSTVVLKDICRMIMATNPYIYLDDSWCSSDNPDDSDASSSKTADSREDPDYLSDSQPQKRIVETRGGKKLTVMYNGRPGWITNEKGKKVKEVYDQTLHFLDHNTEKFILAHSWTSTPAATRQPSFCIERAGCVLLSLETRIGGENVKSDRNNDHSKRACEIPILKDGELEPSEELWVCFSGSNNIDSQNQRGALSIAFDDATLNKILRCSTVYADFDGNGHFIAAMKRYFTKQRLDIFKSVCAGCPSGSACYQSFGADGYTLDDMLKETEAIRHSYYSLIKPSKEYPIPSQ
ncbi:hypothetical protein QR680_007577 [Steinernema hermaphroditum]|uniref:Uncharacterized protein n=1 Tax=Steinernema hermaphroditum TaxID=289476 RepID=A0AA39IF07_9BILA|nr:hypothetical protein QR680_007577 [Steinernema hermaphroditum]